MHATNHIRTVILTPYRKGMGPRFRLTLTDTGRCDARGCTDIHYRLTEGTETIFEGSDFSGSPPDADDSDATVGALLVFLTLRPGDTDSEYFAAYTSRQLAFCDAHADALGSLASDRFGGDM